MSYTGRGLSAEEIEQYSGDKVVATSIIFAILTSIFLGLRFYSKSLMRSRSGWDDILLVAAYLFNVGLCAVGIAMTKFAGVGRHEEWVRLNDPSQIVRWAQFVLVFQFLHFTGVGLPKIAILFFYIRVFNWKGRMLATCYATMGLLVATWLACDLAACFQCRPLAFWWDNTIPGGTCFNVQNFYRAQAITSPILDTIVLVLPVRSIWGLNLPERKRIELLLVFGVASVGLVASIVRVQIFFTTAAFKDRTWASVDLCGWSVIEVGTYIITACLPEMKPLGLASVKGPGMGHFGI
ncbi:hypothetical protein N8I77_005468 [Diaporthe amygdali]|uniref:Rhodopsin domain-containing protein n=1 Tax=Phomopsis amygdali TaxID=1214568 RepID=A0AAD9SEZ4_PHOAM|nr:hypothetical protein N8I77_005468 [Diaporthe amygdali]